MRALGLDDVRATAQVYRATYDNRLPWLSGRHTAAEDLKFFTEYVFRQWDLWGEFVDGQLVGFMATRTGWVEMLYVLPSHHGQGIGSRLINQAKEAQPELQLWTFRRNTLARQFYEQRGFVVMKFTDGTENVEREPDVLYHWAREGAR